MKPFLKNSLLFLFVFFILEKGFYYFLQQAPKLEYDTRLEQVVEGEMNKEIIVLGSSRGADNILAGEIEKATGLTTYNLSYPGSDVTFHAFILETLLRFNKAPKKVILAIDNPYEFIPEKTLVFRLDRLYPLSKYNYINQELINQNEKNSFSKVFCLARLNKSTFSFKKQGVPVFNPIDSFGSMPFLKKSAKIKFEYKRILNDYSKAIEVKEKVNAFKDIQQLCEANNVELIYVFSPNFRTFNTAFYNRFNKEVETKNKIMIYDSLNPIYKNEEYYYDESHLLKKGALVFTKEIADFINSK